MEEAALLSAGERSDRAIIADFEQRRMVRGDGGPGRGQGLAEEDDGQCHSRMDWGVPEGVIAAMLHQAGCMRQDLREYLCRWGSMHGSQICRSGRINSLLLWVRTEGSLFNFVWEES